MSELEKRFIAEALRKKYEQEYGKTAEAEHRPMTKGCLVDDEGKPIVRK